MDNLANIKKSSVENYDDDDDGGATTMSMSVFINIKTNNFFLSKLDIK